MDGSESNNKNGRRLALGEVFADNRAVLVISLLLAFVCWMVATGNSENIVKRLEDVKISIDTTGQKVGERTLLPFFEEGMGKDSYFVNIELSGPQLYVNKSLTAENFSVTLDTSAVDKPGSYSVSIVVKKKDGVDPSVEVRDYSPKTLTLYFDEYMSTSLPLSVQSLRNEQEIGKKDLAPEGYLAEEPVASLKTVTVSGASEQIKKITKVVARVNVPERLTKTTVADAELVALTDSVYPLKYITLSAAENEAAPVTPKVTMLIKKIYELKTAVSFGDTLPSHYKTNPLQYTVSPSRVRIAIEAERDPGEMLYIGLLDFSRIDARRNEFTFPVSSIIESGGNNAYVTVLDPDVTNFKVTVDASQMVKKTLDTPVAIKNNLTIYAVQDGLKVTAVTQSIRNVTVIAPTKDILDKITASSIRVEVDFSNVKLSEGRTTVNAHLIVGDNSNSWCFGKYPIEIEVSKV